MGALDIYVQYRGREYRNVYMVAHYITLHYIHT